jgi:hypothetical protein
MTPETSTASNLSARTKARLISLGKLHPLVVLGFGILIGALLTATVLRSPNASGESGLPSHSSLGPPPAPSGSGGGSTGLDRSLNHALNPVPKAGPEAQLLTVYQTLAEGQFERADKLSQELVTKYPNFALARMLQADLLATRAGQPAALGAPVDKASAAQAPNPRRLEALRRLSARLDRPAAGLVPREFARLAPDVRTALAVDASRSRLYMFRNGPDGLNLVADFYVSVGKAGVSKSAEGDMRTPLGVYWITSTLTPQQIRPMFGAGAMGLNYPNAWDRSQGKGGRGLYIHGVPDETLAREPYATDGCVVLSNSDYQVLAAEITPTETPVVISESLEWVTPAKAAIPAQALEPILAARNAARSMYASNGESAWHERNGGFENLPGYTQAPFNPSSVIGWFHDETPLLVVTGLQAADDPARPPMAIRQYWTRREGQWRMVFEGAVPPEVTVEPPPVAARQRNRNRGA